MKQDMEYRQKQVEEYKQVIMPLLRYLPWLGKNAGKEVSSNYSGSEVSEHSISFPVYDGTLMNFVKEASKTSLMNRNYKYIYVRNNIQNHEDERRLIKKAGIRDWELLCGILSKYVLGGRTRGALWSEAATEGIFYLVLDQMKSIVEYWDKPIDLEEL